jgi:hypothetical protein
MGDRFLNHRMHTNSMIPTSCSLAKQIDKICHRTAHKEQTIPGMFTPPCARSCWLAVNVYGTVVTDEMATASGKVARLVVNGTGSGTEPTSSN